MMKIYNNCHILAVLLAVISMGVLPGCGTKEITLEKTVLEKNSATNPIVGNSKTGEYIYGGDPSVLADGDTVYIYTGHDASTDEEVSKSIYNIPEYLCYSSTDLVNWQAEGVIMDMDTVKWANDDQSAWAAQVAKHFDEETQKDLYYLYYCTWAKGGKQSIGVAVADAPTGPFTDIGEPLVHASVTKPQTSSFNDIDPTVWIEQDEAGEEHIYLAWGNGIFYICELNSDMISVKDQNGDGKITSGKDIETADVRSNLKGLTEYTEAPWIYRRSDENGNVTGDYYLFYAKGWREGWAYSTTDDLLKGEWTYGELLMTPNATSNTNHMGVFDFQGKTYALYHNGSLPGGNGYRRSACLMEITFNEDGSVNRFTETTAGVAGQTVSLVCDGILQHENIMNSSADADYPMKLKVCMSPESGEDAVGNDFGRDAQWVLCFGKSDPDNEEAVSIQAENKPGLYLTVDQNQIVLTPDTDATDETAAAQTFYTYKGLNGDEQTVSFESAAAPGMWITVQEDGTLVLTDIDKLTADEALRKTCSFTINQ